MLAGTLWGVLVCQVFYNYKDWKCENHENKKHVHLETGHLNWPLEVQFSSVAQSCLTLCNPIDCSTPGFSVHHQHPESTQTHVHRVGDAIQPSHPLLSPSPPTFNHCQHQGLFPPRACSNSCPLSRWCHPTNSSSIVPFSSHLQSFPASGSFPS